MVKVRRVYLDNAATTPVDDVVINEVCRCLTDVYGNPSSLHREGLIAKKLVDDSRKIIAKVINSDASEVIFTSGGTESDNLAILGIARANKDKGRHIITSCVEHKAVLDSCHQLESEGFDVTYLGVNQEGVVSVDEFERAIRPDTILVSIMYANNEIGSIQPIKQVAEIINKSTLPKPIFHIDACQASGALTINVKDLGVDAMTISSSKVYGPKGAGALFLRDDCAIQPILYGGGQERGIRSGTESTALIAGFAKALQIAEAKRQIESLRLAKLRDYLLEMIMKNIDGIYVNGGMDNRLPNNLNLSIKGVEGESLVLLLDDKGIACSTGSACSSADLNPSYVLINIGLPIELAHCSVRFSLGRYTSKKDIDFTVKILTECVGRIRSMSSIK